MGKTGIDPIQAPHTGIDKKYSSDHLEFHTENNKMNIEYKQKILDKVFSECTSIIHRNH